MKVENEKTVELYEGVCQYQGCGKIFSAKRRWSQKYCSDSCRTLASRYRRNGISGSKLSNPRSKGVSDLYDLSIQQQTQLFQWLEAIFKSTSSIQAKTDLFEYNFNRIIEQSLELNSKMSQLENKLAFENKAIHTKLDNIEQQLKVLLSSIADVRAKQSNQDWVVILSSVLGPKVGDMIEKNLLNDGLSKEDKIVNSIEDVKKMLNSEKKK